MATTTILHYSQSSAQDLQFNSKKIEKKGKRQSKEEENREKGEQIWKHPEDSLKS